MGGPAVVVGFWWFAQQYLVSSFSCLRDGSARKRVFQAQLEISDKPTQLSTPGRNLSEKYFVYIFFLCLVPFFNTNYFFFK